MGLFQRLWGARGASRGASASADTKGLGAILAEELIHLTGQARQGDMQAINRVIQLGASQDGDRRKIQINGALPLLLSGTISVNSKRVVIGGGRCGNCGLAHSFAMSNAGGPIAPCSKCRVPFNVDWWELPPVMGSVKLSKEEADRLLGGGS